MRGLMQDHQLGLDHLFYRAERLFPKKMIVSNTPRGIERTTYGEWATRTRRLAAVLDALGISSDGRVATFAWNSARHLELYFAPGCTGRVAHTLNLRLFPATGIPLPFISQGGSALVTVFAALGIIESIAAHRPVLDSALWRGER